MLRTLFLTSALVITVAACGDGNKTDHSASTGAIDSTQLAPPPPAIGSEVVQPPDTAQPVTTYTAVISTSEGDIEVELYGKDAPKTVENFIGLARKNYYNGVRFHRVVPEYIIQSGDPNSRDTTKRDIWGTGGKSFFGKEFADELDPTSPSGRRGYVEGTLAMANRGPNTNTSQFFIVLSNSVSQRLPLDYTIFGFVRNGLDVVHQIEKTGEMGEMPLNPAVITKVIVKEVSL